MFDNSTCGSPPPCLPWISAVLSGLLCLLTVPGNLLVCLAVYKNPYRDLRSPFALLIAQLAVADLIVGLITEPLSVYFHTREGLSLSIDYVSLLHLSYFISCTASVLNIGALTVDRYVAITNALRYRARLGSRRTRCAAVGIWIIAFTLPFVYLEVGYIHYTFVFANTSIILTFVTLVIVQFKVLQGSKSRLIHANDIRTSVAQKKLVLREKRITKTFVFVLIAFIICYLPSCIMIYVMNFCTTCSCVVIHWLRDGQFLLVLVNSLINPVIYAWRLPSFRRAFVALVKARRSLKM